MLHLTNSTTANRPATHMARTNLPATTNLPARASRPEMVVVVVRVAAFETAADSKLSAVGAGVSDAAMMPRATVVGDGVPPESASVPLWRPCRMSHQVIDFSKRSQESKGCTRTVRRQCDVPPDC